MEELTVSVEDTIKELKRQKLIDAIELCEADMFSKISKHTFDTTPTYRYGRGPECPDLQHPSRTVLRV